MNVKPGEYNTNQIIELFGTKKMKDRIAGGKFLGGKEKKLLFARAQTYCDITDLKYGRYLINKVYNINKNDFILPLTKGLNKYLAPVVLTKLLEESEDKFKLTLPFLGWAKKFDIINDNYSLIKSNQEKSSEQLNINSDIMFEYFEIIDNCIKYYLEKCLTILSDKKGLDLIDFYPIMMIKKSYIKSTTTNNNGGININCKYFYEEINDEDRRFVYECEKIAKEKAGITINKEKFYGIKSYIYKDYLKKLLIERNIRYTYSAYKIYCKNIEEIKNTLDIYNDLINNDDNADSFTDIFNEKFIEYIESKAIRRQNKENEKSIKSDEFKSMKPYRMLQNYVEDYNGLSELTINKNSESLRDKIDFVDTVEDIMNEFNIDITKS